jgi:hypothetical protein
MGKNGVLHHFYDTTGSWVRTEQRFTDGAVFTTYRDTLPFASHISIGRNGKKRPRWGRLYDKADRLVLSCEIAEGDTVALEEFSYDGRGLLRGVVRRYPKKIPMYIPDLEASTVGCDSIRYSRDATGRLTKREVFFGDEYRVLETFAYNGGLIVEKYCLDIRFDKRQVDERYIVRFAYSPDGLLKERTVSREYEWTVTTYKDGKTIEKNTVVYLQAVYTYDYTFW